MKRYQEKEQLIKKSLANIGIELDNLFYYDTVTSTMDVAASIDYNSITDKTIIIADEQTQGRGRNRRKWYGNSDDCLFSIVLKDYDFSIPYSMISSLGVYEVLKSFSTDIRLKWINDVFWGPKKISGILTEEKNNRTIIGVGVNINSSKFPSVISDNATSLYIEMGIHYDKVAFLINLIEGIIKCLNEVKQSGVKELLRRWEDASKMRGLMVKVETGNKEQYGIVQGINLNTGSLLLKDGNRLIELYEGTLFFV